MNAEKSIKAAIAWFTDPELEYLMESKISIIDRIILHPDQINKSLDFRKFKSKIGYLSPENNGLMHHKFCIIDEKKVMTGSYNWTVKARRYNKENMLLIDDEDTVRNFIAIYDELKKSCTTLEMTTQISAATEIEDLNIQRLEKEFDDEIQNKLMLLKRHNIGFYARNMVMMNTPVIAAKRIINIKNDTTSALKLLWDLKQLNLSFEESVINKKYRKLFDEETIRRAKDKLSKLDYFKDSQYKNHMDNY